MQIFVSYSSHDDQPEGGRPVGWVTKLLTPLASKLGRRVPRKTFSFWIDSGRALNGIGLLSGPLQQQLQQEIARSAVYIGILSPNYFASAWCIQQELLEFERCHGSENVILVELAPGLPEQELLLPSHFRPDRFLRRCFWTPKSDKSYDETLGLRSINGMAVDAETDPDFQPQLQKLVDDLATRLLARRNAPAVAAAPVAVASLAVAPAAAPASQPVAAVFVAESSQGMQTVRQDLIRALVEEHVPVIDPLAFSKDDDAKYCQQVALSLGQSNIIFAQVLDEDGGRILENNGESVVTYQVSVAKECRAAMVQWRTVPPESGATPGMQKTLQGENVQGETFPQFVRGVLALAQDPPVQARVVVRRDHTCDYTIDAAIKDVLRKKNLTGYFGSFAANHRLERELQACEALILVQGAVSKDAIEQHFKECDAALKTRTARRPQIGLLRLPPPKMANERASVRALTILCEAGFDPLELEGFLDPIMT